MTGRDALAARITAVLAEIEALERRPGRRTMADRTWIADRSRYLSGLEDAYKIVFGERDETADKSRGE